MAQWCPQSGPKTRRNDAIAQGASDAGAEVDIRRVTETVLDHVAARARFVTDRNHPQIEDVDALGQYEGTVVG